MAGEAPSCRFGTFQIEPNSRFFTRMYIDIGSTKITGVAGEQQHHLCCSAYRKIVAWAIVKNLENNRKHLYL